MKEEHKTSKALKGQLLGAISMMLVAAIALGTSTYAWFINNQAVEVKNMNLTVSTSTSLLVSIAKQADLATYTNPKTLITNDDIISTDATIDGAGWTDFLKTPMIPASVTDAELAKETPAFFVTDNHVNNGKLDQFTSITRGKDAKTVGQGPVKHLRLKFTSSEKVDVYFGASDLTALADLITAGTGSVTSPDAAAQALAMKKVLRVAIFPAGATSATVLQFDTGSATTENVKNNTDYNGAVLTGAPQDETKGQYTAIATVGTGNKVATVSPLTAQLPAAATTKYLAKLNTTSGLYEKPADAGAAPLFTVNKADMVVDVYMWLEGTDNDCLNELSTYAFNLRLPFAGVLNTTKP